MPPCPSLTQVKQDGYHNPKAPCASSNNQHKYNNEDCYKATVQCVAVMCDAAFAQPRLARLKKACK